MSEHFRMSDDPKDPHYRLVVRAIDGAFEGLYEIGHEELTSSRPGAVVTESRCFCMKHEELVWVHEAIGAVLAAKYREQQEAEVQAIRERDDARVTGLKQAIALAEQAARFEGSPAALAERIRALLPAELASTSQGAPK